MDVIMDALIGLFSGKIITLSVMAVALMFALGRAVPVRDKKLNATKFWKRWGLLMLVGLTIGGAFLPFGDEQPWMDIGNTLKTGFIAAMVALICRTILPEKLRQKIEKKLKDEVEGKGKTSEESESE